MKVLIIGGGGREHTLAWKTAQSPMVSQVFCAPGNAGTAAVGQNVPLDTADLEAMASFARWEGVDLTVVGPEAPLVAGIVDLFQARGLRVFGPTKEAAEIEGSKVFAKKLMSKYKIPTGAYAVFDNPHHARDYIHEMGGPLVVKADGLAAGKGAVVCQSEQEALKAVDMVMEERVFGAAGDSVLIEELLCGEEASYIAFTDGERLLPMPSSQDHKPVLDGDRGPNTGGMGAYSPAPVVTPEVEERIISEVMMPAIKAMASEGRRYRGVLYAGLMIKDGQPMVLEFNARMGDPETQPLLMRLESDLVPVLLAVADGELGDDLELTWWPGASVCVVMASGGYPGEYVKGRGIRGLEEASAMDDVEVFHAGTLLREGEVVTAGGRVLGVTSRGENIRAAVNRAYQAVSKIAWEGVHYRRDIGARASER